MAQSIPFKVALEDRTEPTETRAKIKPLNDYDSNEQGKSIESCSFATTTTRAKTITTTSDDTKTLGVPNKTSGPLANDQRLLSLAIISESMVPALINLARLPLASFWPISCLLGHSLAIGATWLARLAGYYFIGWRSTTSESKPSVKMESVGGTKNLQQNRRGQVNEKVDAGDIYTTIEFTSTNKQQQERIVTLTTLNEEKNVSPTKMAFEKLDTSPTSQHSATSDSWKQQQVVAKLLSEELSELLIGEALEGAFKMSCTQAVAVDQPALMSKAPTSEQTNHDQVASSESIKESIEFQQQQQEEKGDEKEEEKEETEKQDEMRQKPSANDAAQSRLSNFHELQQPRSNSEVDRYSDQLAQIFTSLAGIDQDNEDSREQSAEVSEIVDDNGDDTLLGETRMTTANDKVGAAHQDNEGESSILDTITQAIGGQARQEEASVTGERSESSASREDLSLPRDLNESVRPTNDGEQPSDIGQSSFVADGRTTVRQESLIRSTMDEQSPKEGLQNTSYSSVTNLDDKHEAGMADEHAQIEKKEKASSSSSSSSFSSSSSSADSNFSDSSSADLPGELSRSRKEEEPSSGEEGSCCASECVCDDDAREEFCGETASNSTLRRLKMSTFEDVLVCEQNRHSMAAARRLFGRLALGDDPNKQAAQVSGSEEKSVADRPSSDKWGGSLSSAEEPEEESADEMGDDLERSTMTNKGTNHATSSDDSSDQVDSSSLKGFDTIKIVRRSGSSASSSNFRQTLVCSVSPTSQLEGGSNLDVSNTDTNQHPIYPIDGDEILQCRAAFRENKRLIEEQQERANNDLTGRDCSSPRNRTHSPLTGGSNQQTSSTRNFRLHRDLTPTDQTIQQSKCSRCKQRVYPVDKMELDFTRATLNIHRNCFKCQICSTLLRLETYAALDAKLYCPSHIKCAIPSR